MKHRSRFRGYDELVNGSCETSMYVGALRGVRLRQDDGKVTAALAECRDPGPGDTELIAVMNEAHEVCRIVVCGSTAETGRVHAAFQRLGFEQQDLKSRKYRDLVCAIYWKP